MKLLYCTMMLMLALWAALSTHKAVEMDRARGRLMQHYLDQCKQTAFWRRAYDNKKAGESIVTLTITENPQ